MILEQNIIASSLCNYLQTNLLCWEVSSYTIRFAEFKLSYIL